MTLLKPTRRDLLKLAAAAPAFAMPVAARAQLGAPTADNPAHFRFSIGDIRLTILSDGFFSSPTSGLGVNADPAEVQAFLSQHFLSPTDGYSHTNHLLIETGEATILVDVGSGNRWFETTGRLLDNMDAAGVDPADITHVVITHAHPDHIWGIRDDFDEAIFPDAEYIVGSDERAFWLQDGLVNKVSAAAQQFVVGAGNSLNVDGADWTLAEDGHEIVTGVRVIATPGHTPGVLSTSFTVYDKGYPHAAVLFGGAGLNFDGVERTQSYIDSIAFLQSLPGVEVNIPNHADSAEVFERAEALLERKPDAPHPFVDPEGWSVWLDELMQAAQEKMATELEKEKK